MTTCDDEGAVWHDLKKVGKVEVVQPEKRKGRHHLLHQPKLPLFAKSLASKTPFS
jgi:hypothetical protein